MYRITALSAVAALSLSACDGMSSNQRAVVGGLTGAAVGLAAADLLDANSNWTTVAALGGAAAGVLVARNTRTGQCAYSDGRGGYYAGHCR